MDYSKLGLKVGIEIHQRLDTKTKLFCACSTRMLQQGEKTIVRKLKAVAGELGNVDPAALYELMRGREFVYHVYGSCLVEQDEEPPRDLNREALYMALQIARLLKASVPDEIHVMRKTVIDGSNTSGFQRTAVVAFNGTLETSEGPVAIPSISLEEEAAQILSREGAKVEYGLDRLGIPLIEISTSVMKSAKQAKEAALTLGMLLRSVKVQRGLGTIRQDVNISVAEGARVEIKGFQDIAGIEKLIELEAERQHSLIELAKELSSRKVSSSEIIDATEVFRSAKNRKIASMIKDGNKVWSLKLEGLAGLLKRKISGERTFGKELSGYAKTHGSGIMHSDEDLDKNELSDDFRKLGEKLHASNKDFVIISIGERKAMEAVRERALNFLKGVPEETREANEDYTTSYSRPLPGKSRLYPETDVAPVKPFQVELPETPDKKKSMHLKAGLSEQLSNELLRSPFGYLFDEFSRNPTRTAIILTSTLKELKRDSKDVDKISEDNLRELLSALEKADIPKEKVYEILVDFTQGKAMGSVESAGRDEVISIIEDEIMKNKDMIEKEGDRAFQKLMGLVMTRLRGKASGSVISEELRKRLKK